MKKYYDILGLDMSASIEEVEQAYKKLSETWNPQTYQNLPRYRRKAEIKSKEINEAYERLRTFLLAKPAAEDQENHVLDGQYLSETIQEKLAPEETIPPQISKSPQRKTMLYGLIAIAAVFGALMFYQISDRKKPEQQSFQTAVIEEEKPTAVAAEEKPTVATSSQGSSTARLQKESEAEPSGELAAAEQLPSGKSAEQQYVASTDKQKIAQLLKTDYNALLTEEALDKYNQDPQRVKRAQRGLIANGYDTGPLDGIIGPHTTTALKQFASDHGVEAHHGEGLVFRSFALVSVRAFFDLAKVVALNHAILARPWFGIQLFGIVGSMQIFLPCGEGCQLIISYGQVSLGGKKLCRHSSTHPFDLKPFGFLVIQVNQPPIDLLVQSIHFLGVMNWTALTASYRDPFEQLRPHNCTQSTTAHKGFLLSLDVCVTHSQLTSLTDSHALKLVSFSFFYSVLSLISIPTTKMACILDFGFIVIHNYINPSIFKVLAP